MSETATLNPIAGGPAPQSLEYAPPRAKRSLKAAAVRGSVWTIVGYGASQALRLGSNLVLTRLLFPEAFGKMALVSVFLQGLQMFSDVGIGPSIIQNKRGDDPGFLNTAWTIQVLRGFALSIACALLAWPLAQLYGQPDLGWLVAVAGLSCAIQGFGSTALFRLPRHLALGKVTTLELVTQFVAAVVCVLWAWSSRTVWPLVGATLIGTALRTLGSHWLDRSHRDRLHWDPSASRALFSFGKWIFISTLITFFAGQADRLIFGLLVPVAFLGVYSIAVQMAMLPTQAIYRLAGPLAFSVYARVGDGGEDRTALLGTFHTVRLPLLVAGGVGASCLIAVGPSLIHLLYDQRYEAAGWMLQLLVAGAWFEVLEMTIGSALLAMGQSRWVAAGNAGKMLAILALLPLGFWLGGSPQFGLDPATGPFFGALLGLVGSDIVRYAISALAIRRQGLGVVRHDVLFTLFMIAGTAMALASGWLVREMDLSRYAEAGLAALAAFGVVGALWAPLAVRCWRQFRGA